MHCLDLLFLKRDLCSEKIRKRNDVKAASFLAWVKGKEGNESNV